METLLWLEIVARWVLGCQFLFWGLNGFFHWRPIPRSSEFIEKFSELCYQSRFILPTVKIFEVLFGAVLLSGYGIPLALVFLGPIVFVITGLHYFHNANRGPVIASITLPYMVIFGFHLDQFRSLLMQ